MRFWREPVFVVFWTNAEKTRGLVIRIKPWYHQPDPPRVCGSIEYGSFLRHRLSA